jgi:hypothetical protein
MDTKTRASDVSHTRLHSTHTDTAGVERQGSDAREKEKKEGRDEVD